MPRRKLQIKILATAGLLIVLTLVVVVSVVFLNPTSVGSRDFVANITLWSALWALSFLITLTLSFVLARDLVKLFFEFRGGEPGSRIKTKLVTTFVVFSLFPALIMSFLAYGLINRNLRLWFTSPAEQFLDSSGTIIQSYYTQNQQLASLAAAQAKVVLRQGLTEAGQLRSLGFSSFKVLSSAGQPITEGGDWIESRMPSAAQLAEILAGEAYYDRRRLLDLGKADEDLVMVATSVDRPDEPPLVFVGQMTFPHSVEFHAIQAGDARIRYEELKKSVDQIQLNYISILILTTLALIFGFVWLGTYIARKLTVPLEALAGGARALSTGNFDYRVAVSAVDELGVLVDSFNKMAAEIKSGRQRLEAANDELRAKNAQIQERREYIETVLQNVATGVLSVDDSGIIRTVNEAALRMLQTTREQILDRPLSEAADEELTEEFKSMKRRALLYGTCRKDITLRRNERVLYIAATVTPNPVPEGATREYLIVLDELTELIQAQKSAAWQEVARRLAHEIKNPLTPIQLSIDRIRKRFEKVTEGSSKLDDFEKVLKEGVDIISAEAQMLKTLVSEFSRFARLPISQPEETDLHQLLEQTIGHYNGVLDAVNLKCDFDETIQNVRIDPEQMRRVFVNLIDNALDALSEKETARKLEIVTRMNAGKRSVTIEFRDNGCGLPAEDLDDLFLPYFSTKQKGTGLGLAIVRQIVSDHNGYIRAEPNIPEGTTFRMEIPLGRV